MISRYNLLFEIIFVVALLLTAVLCELLFDVFLTALIVVLLFYLGWHGFQLYRLLRLLQQPTALVTKPPPGIWNTLYCQLGAWRQGAVEQGKKLIRARSLFRDVTGAFPDAVVLLTAKGMVQWCNQQAGTLLGLSWPQVKGSNLLQQLDNRLFEEYIEQGNFDRPLQIEAPTDASTMLSVRVRQLNKKKNRCLLIARDITRFYHLDREKRDFVANSSHELRTPLTVISGFLETMDNDGIKTEREARSIQLMRKQAQRMQDIISDLAELSRIELSLPTAPTELVDVPMLLQTITDEAGLLSAGSHQIELNTDQALLLQGDQKTLYGAFSNLVFNAVRHTPQNSRIRLRWWRDHNGANFSVSDTGTGIPARHLPRLTERFYRVDSGRSRESGGTGLGLAIVKHILLHHNSDLIIESEEGKGSTFSCCFPQSMVVERTASRRG